MQMCSIYLGAVSKRVRPSLAGSWTSRSSQSQTLTWTRWVGSWVFKLIECEQTGAAVLQGGAQVLTRWRVSRVDPHQSKKCTTPYESM